MKGFLKASSSRNEIDVFACETRKGTIRYTTSIYSSLQGLLGVDKTEPLSASNLRVYYSEIKERLETNLRRRLISEEDVRRLITELEADLRLKA